MLDPHSTFRPFCCCERLLWKEYSTEPWAVLWIQNFNNIEHICLLLNVQYNHNHSKKHQRGLLLSSPNSEPTPDIIDTAASIAVMFQVTFLSYSLMTWYHQRNMWETFLPVLEKKLDSLEGKFPVPLSQLTIEQTFPSFFSHTWL